MNGVLMNVLAGTLVVYTGAQVRADVIYDNGPFDGASGVSFGSSITADDFVLADDATLGSVGFDAFHTAGQPMGPTLEWQVHADDGGAPGAMVASGLAQNVMVTPLEGEWSSFHVDFDLGQSVALEAGTAYWLALYSPDGPVPTGLAWGSSTDQTGNLCHRLFPGSEEWVEVGVDLNFTLVAAAPCPADTNGDLVVDVVDLVNVIVDWGCTGAPPTLAGDVNGDGVVDVQDLVMTIVNWGPCP